MPLFLCLIFIRPFISGLTYPVFEIYYELSLILFALLSFLNSLRKGINPLGFHYKAPILILLSGYLISTIFSIDIRTSVRHSIFFLSCISIFYITTQLNEKHKNILVQIIAAGGIIIGLYAIYQYFYGYQQTLLYLNKINSQAIITSSYARDILIDKRAIGTFPSPNILGGYLIMIFFLNLSMSPSPSPLPKGERVRVRGIKLLTYTIIILSLILTKSLGALISFIAVLIILFFTTMTKFRYRKVILIGFCLFIVLSLGFIISKRSDRLLNLKNPQNSITQRINYWHSSANAIKAHPFLGIGAGNLKKIYLQYKAGNGTNTIFSHNIFLQTYAELGIMGFLGILLLVISFIKEGFNKPELKFIYLAGLTFILHNLVDNTYFIPETAAFWWVLCGLTAVFSSNNQHAVPS